MALGKGAGEQDGIWLGKKEQRVSNLRPRTVELVVPQFPVARRVHSQHKQPTLVPEGGVGDDFDDGLRNTHPWSGANRL